MNFNKLSKNCLQATTRLTEKYNSRITGSPMCLKAGDELYRDFNTFCDKSFKHDFIVRPNVFYGYTKILPLVFLAGILTFFLPRVWTIIPLIGLIMGIMMMITIFGYYTDFFDRFYRKKKAANIIGSIEPKAKARQQIIISGHHDSAPVTNLFHPLIQKFLIITMFAPYLFYIFQIVLCVYALLYGTQAVPMWCLWVLFAGIPFVLLYFYAVNMRRGTPGAGDNMIASVITARIGKAMTRLKHNGFPPLMHTRIILASFDGEEAGLRGSAAYFKEYGDRFKKIPTYHLNIESLYKLKDLHVLESDVNGAVKLSEHMAHQIIQIGKKIDIKITPFKMIFGAGATDAAESARVGITSTTIFGLPTSIFRDGMVYHTVRDTVDKIEPETVKACVKIILTIWTRR